CVRDSILKRPVKDIDIATPSNPQEVIKVLEQAGVKVIPTGLAHGTVTAIIKKHHFEITTLRIDVKTDGRRATVKFTDDWTQDAARRDFTINTMSANDMGDIFDPYDGLEDLAKGKVRFVGAAESRINEDVLRMLRFFRFYAEYGRPPIDAEAMIACRKLRHRLGELSGERIRGELFRILMAPNPADIFALMRSEKILDHILPEAGDVGRLRALAWLVERGIMLSDINTDPVRRLGALIKPGTNTQEIKNICSRLKFSKRESGHLVAIASSENVNDTALTINSASSEKDIRRACYLLGKDIVMDKALIEWAGEISITPHQQPGKTDKWKNILSAITSWQVVRFPLKGRHGLDFGLKQGPELGLALKKVEQWWMDQDFRPDLNTCLERLRDESAPASDHPSTI
ncbi:MAG: CCA tRNA nucleotidyltransferase, partial [Rhodospirillaceae bacterium]|nr:CCA tRNA nucleotidyltransferase [Rhodospirillaceae bacterium]